MTHKSRSGTHRTRSTKRELRRFAAEEPLKEEMLELDFRKGIRKAAELAGTVKTRPILIAVFGSRDSGKSHFISKLLEELPRMGMSTVGYHSTASQPIFESIRSNGKKQDKPDGYIFHCAEKRDKEDRKSADFLSMEILGKRIDVSIAIYNPTMHRSPEGEFDLIVCNTGSFRKRPAGG